MSASRIIWPKLSLPLVAILRGIKPEETEAIVGVLIEEGFEAIEIPLNSPMPFHSIEKAVKLAPANVLIGAGTVLSIKDVDQLHNAGGRLVVSPNIETEVIQSATSYGMVTMPGVFTPTEAFAALKAGASALKFFPASILGADGIKAVRAVLSVDTIVGAVGGVSEQDFGSYRAAGVNCFGLGSSLYKAGFSADDVRESARKAVRAWKDIAG